MTVPVANPDDEDTMIVNGDVLVPYEPTVYSPDDIASGLNMGTMNEEEASSRWSQFS